MAAKKTDPKPGAEGLGHESAETERKPQGAEAAGESEKAPHTADGKGKAAKKSVPLKRDPERFEAPHTADVHPDEVEGWLAAHEHGWERA